ncbi:MAG: UvrD-helicase domain-containing protein [Ideonella sp.]|nr:UvrD-helicase domain-containing protein [Ideonella sp.]
MSAHDPVQDLSPLSFPLWGSRLIEASAGTGKTWTMAALYVRLVLGHGGAAAHPQPLRPDQILVMTFTRAATRELSDRIRARLVQAAQAFRAELNAKDEDDFLRALKADIPPEQHAAAAWRLAQAATSMDDAAIHTIDAWCQRMLREHALDSGSLFDETLQPNEQTLRLQAQHDVWRQQAYPLSPDQMAALVTVWPDVNAMAADLKDLLPHTLPSATRPRCQLGRSAGGGRRRAPTPRSGGPGGLGGARGADARLVCPATANQTLEWQQAQARHRGEAAGCAASLGRVQLGRAARLQSHDVQRLQGGRPAQALLLARRPADLPQQRRAGLPAPLGV